MLSYQHSYHAGNPADLHKHIVLAELLTLLIQKPRAICFAETHAGRALYDLSSPEALKTGEAQEGVERIDWGTESPFERVLSKTRRTHGDSAYPGSPTIALNILRGDDRAVFMELHPQESGALAFSLRKSRAEIHHRDGYEGLLALSPMKPRRGLVLIDPAYEVKSEYDQVSAFVPSLLKKWPEASILVWYPILNAGRHMPMVEALSAHDHLRDDINFSLKEGRGMTASGMMIINPPFGAEACFEAAHRLAGAVISRR